MSKNLLVNLQLSIGLPNFGSWISNLGWSKFPSIARVAEDEGIDRIVLVDHVSMGRNTAAYRWGRFPTTPDAPWSEPFTLLAGMATLTSRIRLATGVALPSLRGATLFAKTTATLDVLSEGRLELGVGIGWQREEYDAAGLDWDCRADIFDETLAATVRLWTESPASYDGEHVRFSDVFVSPTPFNAQGVPLLIAGTLTERNLRRISQLGSGWIPIMGASLDEISDGVSRVREALKSRPQSQAPPLIQVPVPLERRGDAWDIDATMARLPDVRATGATIAHLPLHIFCADPRDSALVLRRIRTRFDTEMSS